MKVSLAGCPAPRRKYLSVMAGLLFVAVLISVAVSGVVADEDHHDDFGHTAFLTAVAIPGNPIRSFDISWADSERSLYFLGDRSNSGVDIISTTTNTFIGRAGGFVGIKLLPPANTTVDNNHSGPDGVVSHGRCLYAGDGDSTLKVFDISDPTNPQLVATLSTGGKTRLDEMALTPDGDILIAVNNAEDPPYATVFNITPDGDCDSIALGAKITVDPAAIPPGFGLSIEQPTWVKAIHRFVVSVPVIANNSFDAAVTKITGVPCNYGQVSSTAPITCSGAVLVIDPTDTVDPVEKIISLNQCGPNGVTAGPHGNIMEGCTPNNQKTDVVTTILNTKTLNYVNVGNLTGSDEVWFNPGSNRYYTGSSAMPGGAVLGVVDGTTNFLLETIPQSSASHSVAADSELNEIYVPQVAPKSVVGIGGDVTGVGQALCGTTNGCVAVFAAGHHEEHEGDDDN